ncbi:enoyl-CoA hydratase/isomerase family protein [Paracrocinitomix mangrovi]|uniref:enoyl-CoA hydratase/isomerase family protein n=1 Tax=Paracrocinitomix mangrovi TaxID=2862509 RepID=UPI003AB92C94
MIMNNLIIEQDGHIAIITINRPSQLNALNKETIDELNQALTTADNDPNTGVIILTGSGEKAFVAGADIKEFANFSVEKGKALSAEGHDKLFNYVENLSTPVIAAVNGFALGGGLELAMSAHFRIASDNARVGLPEVSLGVIPGYGGTQRLAQLIGRGKAFELIMTAGMISAEEAMSWGLVNHVVPQAELMDLAKKIASKILNNSPNAIAAAIRAVNAGYQEGVDGMKAEIEEFGKCFGTPEFIEGTTAFVEKRKAEFRK